MFISRVLRSKAIWFGLILCFDVSAAPRLAQSVVNSYQETASVDQTLMWRWRDSAETSYQIRYKLDGTFKQVEANGTHFGLPKDQLMQLQWKVPHGAGEITLQQYRLKKLVAESESVSPPVITAKLDEHAGHMGHASHNHVPPGEATKWMFTEFRAKSGSDDPNVNPAIPRNYCPVGSTDAPFGRAAPGECDAGAPSFGDPISLVDGAFWIKIPCLNLAGAGRNISFSLHYDTHKVIDNIGYAGIGMGWIASYQRRLSWQGSYIYFVQEDGSYHTWAIGANNTFTSESNNYAKLNLNPQAQEYSITYQNGDIDIFDSAGILIRVQDRIGNSTVISAFSVDQNGIGRRTIKNQVTNQSLTLEHIKINQLWRLTRVVESGPNPREMNLGYGTSGNDIGKLVAVIDVSGRKYSFNYDAQSRITKYWDSNNDPLNPASRPVVNEYFAPALHGVYDTLQVEKQTSGDLISANPQ